MNKVCLDCGESKSLNQFYPKHKENFSSPAKVSAYCKRCWKLRYSTMYSEVSRSASRKRYTDGKSSMQVLRRKVIAAYGGSCFCCGESHQEFLTLDHKNLDGGPHREKYRKKPRAAVTWWVYQDALREMDRARYQVLCWNCNRATAFGKPCPHALEHDQRAFGGSLAAA